MTWFARTIEPVTVPERTLADIDRDIREIEPQFTAALEQQCRHVRKHPDPTFRVGNNKMGVPVNQMYADPPGRTLARETESIRLRRNALYAERAVKMLAEGLIR